MFCASQVGDYQWKAKDSLQPACPCMMEMDNDTGHKN